MNMAKGLVQACASVFALTMATATFALQASAAETLTIPYLADIGSFDPDNAFEVGALSAISNVYEGLVEYEPGTVNIRGRLATSWSISDDGLTYTFELVQGAKFHDGTPFDAKAVVVSFERRRDRDMILGYFLMNVKTIEAKGDNTVVLTLAGPQTSFLDSLASPWGPKVISPKALTDNAGNDFGKTWFTEHAVGTGPFVLSEFRRGQEYVLEKFDEYHGKAAFFDEIRIPVVPDIGQQLLQLQANEIDAVPTGYPWGQLANLPDGLEATASPSMALIDLFVKPGTAMDKPDVRNAVLTAINPALWAKDVFGDYATPAQSLYPVAMLKPKKPISFPTDMDAAKAAIANAGPVSLTIGYGSSEAANVGRVADIMIAQLAQIGVTATASPLPSGAVYSYKKDSSAAPDLLLSRLSPDAAHPDNQAAVFYTTGAMLNLFGVSLPEADALVAEGAKLTDTAARNALYEQAGQMYFDKGLFIPLVDVQDVVVHGKGLTGLGLRPVFPPGNIDFSSAAWSE